MSFKFLIISIMAIALLFDEASANTCPRWVKLNKSPVCFGAEGNQYGHFSYSQNVFVSQFMLVHRSGTVTCNKNSKGRYSYWGCTPDHANMGVVLTDDQNEILAPASSTVNQHGWYNLAGYTSSSSAVVFCHKKPHCIFRVNGELRLWYGQDLKGYTESDNTGKTCADVYGLLA